MENQSQLQHLIVKIVHENDHNAFKAFYELYFEKAFSLALFLTNNKSTAEEVVADVFTGIWNHRHLLERVRNITAYVMISVRNRAGYYNKNKRTIPQEAVDFEIFVEPDNDTPYHLLEKKEFFNQLQKAIHSLPDRCRMIFYLVKEEGLSYKEVAKILNISHRTVNAQMVLAVKKIAEFMRKIQK